MEETTPFHTEKFEAHGVAFLDDAKNIILKMADRIRELELIASDKKTGELLDEAMTIYNPLRAPLTKEELDVAFKAIGEWESSAMAEPVAGPHTFSKKPVCTTCGGPLLLPDMWAPLVTNLSGA